MPEVTGWFKGAPVDPGEYLCKPTDGNAVKLAIDADGTWRFHNGVPVGDSLSDMLFAAIIRPRAYSLIKDDDERAARKAIDVLNSALEADYDAVFRLVTTGVACNKALAEHRAIQCHTDEPGFSRVSALGLINGLFGVLPDGYGLIAAEFDIDQAVGTRKLTRFVCTLDHGHERAKTTSQI